MVEQESSSVKFEMSALVMEKEQAVKVSVYKEIEVLVLFLSSHSVCAGLTVHLHISHILIRSNSQLSFSLSLTVGI